MGRRFILMTIVEGSNQLPGINFSSNRDLCAPGRIEGGVKGPNSLKEISDSFFLDVSVLVGYHLLVDSQRCSHFSIS